MKIKFDEKYTTISLYAIVVFTVCLVIKTFITEIPSIFGYIGVIFIEMTPIIYGVVIAYLLNPLMSLIEKHLKPLFFKSSSSEISVEKSLLNNSERVQLRKRHKMLRATSIVICLLITIMAIIAIMAMVVPELINSISGLFDKLPYYTSNAYLWVSNLLEKSTYLNDSLKSWIEKELTNMQKEILNTFSSLEPKINIIITAIKEGVSSFVGSVKNICLGLIISVYLLFSKEEFIAQVRKFMYAVLPEKACKMILTLGVRGNSVFLDFIVGKAVDSLIVGIISFITLTILDMPYVVLISLIIGITNMIPFFGPFIGAIPSAILVMLSEPHKAIPFIVFVIVLQQVDGNIIGPKILGNKLGLSTFWIMFAILVFGGLMGPIGMFIGVPLFTLLYSLLSSLIQNLLKSKDLPQDKRYYGNMTITQDGCTFPEKQDYSDEDIDETQVLKTSTKIMNRVREKTNIESIDLKSIWQGFKDKFSNKK